MKHLEYIASKIIAAGLGAPGDTLFISTMPGDVTSGIMLRDMLTGIDIDEEMSDWFQCTVQIIVRDPDVEEGYKIAERLIALLDIHHDTSYSGLYINRLRPITKPVSYPRGDGDEIETAVRFRMSFGET